MRNLFADKEKRRQAGVTTIFIIFALTVLIGIGALAIDGGLIYASRAQLQNSVDAAALAAGQEMFDSDGALNRAAGEDAAENQAAKHRAASADNVAVDKVADVVYGDWDENLRTFTPIALNAANQEDVNAVDVFARLDGTNNAKVPALLSKVRGFDDFEVNARATAYIGFAGSAGVGDIDLPIVVDCCMIGSCPDADPSNDFCVDGNPPISNPNDLVRPQAAPSNNTTSQLEFSPTGTQNACWTQFENTASVNTNDLRDIINGVQVVDPPPNVGDLYNLDNGNKVPVLRAIMRRFEGFPGWTAPTDPLCPPGTPLAGQPNPDYGKPDEPPVAAEGTDAYAELPGEDSDLPDQWFKMLPVFECQNGVDQCASGDNQRLLGFVCVEIREIEAPDAHHPDPDRGDDPCDPSDPADSNKHVRLDFVCRSNPLFEDNCKLTGPISGGGAPFGPRATIPVLVR